MNRYLVLLSLLFFSAAKNFAQDTSKINHEYEIRGSLRQNMHMVFARTPVTSNNASNATQTFKGDDFIYARVFFSKPLKQVLFLEKNDEGVIPVDVFVEDLTNHSSLYISFDLSEDEMIKTFFDFDIFPDPEHCLRPSKEFETGRFSYFLSESGLENKRPVFKFTIGDATGYIQVDFSGTNLQQVKERDLQAYQRAHQVREGDEKQ
ncbi:MAG: hypothetical protein NTV09_11560 [Bacteroidetes bacterium]|nr:hypothetical protein [Bacteroidota bacterium]